MKKTISTIFFAFVTIITCNSQTIEMKKTILGYKFTQNGKRLSMAETKTKMESNTTAFELMKSAKSINTISEIIGGLAGAFIGYPIGKAIAGENPNWTFAGIGVGLVAIGIPISSSGNKKAKQAVDLYNSSLNSTSYKPNFEIIANENGIGIGLTMNF